jgi:hypothetical protein
VDLCSDSFVFPSTRSPIGRLVSCEESCAEQLNLDCVSGKSQFPWPQLGPKLWQGTAQQKLTQKEI